jgi:hypothetical protein
MLSSVSPTHTTSEASLPKGALVMFPDSVSIKYQEVLEFSDVQLNFVSENKARSYTISISRNKRAA